MASRVGPRFIRIDELLAHLGDIPASRVRLVPTPGKATERDLLRVVEREDRAAELIDGTIVEKPMSTAESWVALMLVRRLGSYLDQHPIGELTGEGGLLRLDLGQVRAPDVAFIRSEQLPGGVFPAEPIASLYPDLAVEVLCPSNTRGEMERKLLAYFKAGTTLVWVIDPESRSAEAHSATGEMTKIGETGELDGGDVLPGFRLALRELFAKLPPVPKPSRRKRSS